MASVAITMPHSYTANTMEFTETARCTCSCAGWLKQQSWFEQICACFICFNTVVIGLEVEYAAAEETVGLPFGYRLVEYVTVLWFIVELFIRLFSHGCRHFWWRSQDRVWNYFDAFVVVASIVDGFILFTESGKQNSLLLALKVVRVVRLVRITRVVAVFRDLRMMVYSMFHTLKSLMWFLLLMCLMTYCFAICLTQGTIDHAIVILGEKTDWKDAAEAAPDYMPQMLRDFGSVPRTMFTLLKCVTGGVSWGEAAAVVSHLGTSFTITFLVFITFTIFAMLNVITGFFCEDAAATAAKDKSDAILQQLKDKDSYLKQFKTVFREIDTDKSGYMTLDELHEHIEDEGLQAYFTHLEIDVRTAWEIFRLLDVDGSGTVSIEEFVFGCMKLRGYAKTLDVASINYDVERLRRKTLNKLDSMDEALQSVANTLREQSFAKQRLLRTSVANMR
eukprot:TRINITY_DN15540_c0_g1_i1.p1 TRINITY_DN15540_c0_g1~~TRINITY_DN15540_c0_g1_i1.p1  ORF type:complete len:448 (+),score=69.31 TRINITY_DN15540_c0_g1_i1:187-1530(+)